MSDRDIDELFRRFADLDRELKELKVEVSDLKRFQPLVWADSVGSKIGQQRILRRDNDKPAQWPNEPYTDYLKRIGEYNEAIIYEDDTK